MRWKTQWDRNCKLKQRLCEEGNETVTNCNQLKFIAADGKMRLTDVDLMLNGLAEAATTEISQDRNPQSFGESAQIAHEGGEVADAALREDARENGDNIAA